MTKSTRLSKQQIVNFYFEKQQNLFLTFHQFRLLKTTVREDRIVQYQYSGIDWLAVLYTKQVYTPE